LLLFCFVQQVEGARKVKRSRRQVVVKGEKGLRRR